MALPLMPKATAVWLVEHTTLSFEQIAAFCGLHELEVQAIADGEVATSIQGLDPVAGGQLSKDEITKGEANPAYRLVLTKSLLPQPAQRAAGGRYTPIAKRQDKPDAIAWVIKHYPDMTDAQISKLLGTTKQTIAAIRDRSHWNMANIKARHPVALGLCSQAALDQSVSKLAKPAVEPPSAYADPVDDDDDARPLFKDSFE